MIIAKKVGMSQKFSDNGEHLAITILKLEDNIVVDKREDGALLGGCVKRKVNKPQRVFFEKNNLPLFSLLKKTFCNPENLEVGKPINLDFLGEKPNVDVTGTTKGRGFSGVIRRHNFSSQRHTHGVSLSERVHGSTGQRQDPGRVFKNKKMAGHYGNEQVTIKNLTVVDYVPEEKLLLVQGAVPGYRGSVVFIRKSTRG